MVNHQFPTIYKKTKRGQAQQWSVECQGNSFRTSEGLVGGAITTTDWTVCAGKNVGRANQTTPEAQAFAEAQAKWTKKVEGGYHEKLEDIDSVKFFEPMTAKKWKDYQNKVKYPVIAQPKLDGMRCTINATSATSRGGKNIPAAAHILRQLAPVLAANPGITLDGELYNDALSKDFERVISLAKKQTMTPTELADCEANLHYHIYDVYLPHQPAATFVERNAFLQQVEQALTDASVIRWVESYEVDNEADLNTLHDQWIDAGYEGQMVRDPKSQYLNKRTEALLKRKLFVDEEFEFVRANAGVGNAANRAASVTLLLNDGTGRTFDAGVIGSFEYAADLLINQHRYVGQKATVVYQNLTSDGIPRIGKMKCIRWDC